MKWLFKILFLLTSPFLITACMNTQERKKENPASTIIKGRIQSPPGNTIELYAFPNQLQKFLNQKVKIASATVGKKGRFFLEVNIDQPSAFDLKIGNRILVSNLFLCPGNEINLDFCDSAITSFEKGGRDNSFLLQFDNLFFKKFKTKRDYYVNSNFYLVDEYAEFLNNRKQQQLKLYNEFFSASPAHKEFSTYALCEINYQYAIDKLLYIWKKRIKNKEVIPGEDYFDFSAKDFIENPEAINSPSYVHFLNLYFTIIYEQHLLEIIQSKKKPAEIDHAFEKIKFAKETFSGISLEIIKLNILNEELNSVDSNNLQNSLLRSAIVYQ